MQIKQLLQCLLASSLLVVGGTQQAFAQEDENWYQARLKEQRQRKQSAFSSSQQKPGAMLQRSACDLSANGDMETQLQAPSYTGNMGGQLGGNSPQQLANWFSPTYGTPDYLATNATFVNVDPRQEASVVGSSTVHSGIGEIGLYNRQVFEEDVVINGTPQRVTRDRVSEYATAPLSAGANGLENAQYYAEMWVSLSHATDPCNYGVTNGFGMWFTTTDGFKNTYSRDFLPLPASQFIANSSPISQSAINYGTLGATTWQRVAGQITGNGEKFVTIGSFNSDPANLVLLPGKNASRLNSYVYVDDFQLYKIPTAGPSVAANCADVVIGEGCGIPGATYAWTIQGSNAAPFATTLQVSIRQKVTTTYTLTVTLPNGSTYATSATVTGMTLPAYPIVTQRDPNQYWNKNQAQYDFNNFDPGVTYTITNIQWANPTTPHPTYSNFIVKGGGGHSTNYYGAFTITATNSCGSVTTDVIEPYYVMENPYGTRTTTTAYPNPAAETLTTVDGSKNAVLLNSQGDVVRKADSTGQVDVHDLPAGLYNLRTEQEGRIINQRIQVQH